MSKDLIFKSFQDQVSNQLFTDFEVLVSQKNKIIYHSQSKKNTDLLFDIASLTKPICITSLVLIALSENKISLDQKVVDLISFQNSEVRIIDLLNHQAGFSPYRDYENLIPKNIIGNRDQVKRWFLDQLNQEPLDQIHQKTIYSDLDYILLGFILEKIYELSLDQLFLEKIALPLKLKNTSFIPIHQNKDKIVHDPRAYLLDGISGHAGLFSHAKDIHRWLLKVKDSYLNQKSFFDHDILDEHLNFKNSNLNIRKFILGFDLKSNPSSTGKFFSNQTLGHLGFTGCSFWWDINQDFWIIILTSRNLNPDNLDKMKTFRPLIHDLIYAELLSR
jgi:CubicO group peptidase (beta-lactamase class C family)